MTEPVSRSVAEAAPTKQNTATLPTQGVVLGRIVLAEATIAFVHGLVLAASGATTDAGDFGVGASNALFVPVALALGPAVVAQAFALFSVVRASLLYRTAVRMRADPDAPPSSRSTLGDALAAGPRARLVFLIASCALLAIPWTASLGATLASRLGLLVLHLGAALFAALATEVVFARALSPWVCALNPHELEPLGANARARRVLFTTRVGLAVLGAGLFVTGAASTAGPPSLDALIAACAISAAAAVFAAVVAGRAEERRSAALTSLLGRIKRLEEGAGVELAKEKGDHLADGLADASARAIARALAASMSGVSESAVTEQTAKKSLEEIQRTKTLFVASMSHDLRSPLKRILGFSELLLQGIGGTVNDGQRENVLVIQRSGTELLELLNDIIDSARFDAGRLPLTREWTPTVEILTEAVTRGGEMIEARAGGRDFRIEPHIDPGLPPLRVDRERIVQAVVCLFRHATQAMDGGVIRLEARRVDGPNGREVRVDVATGGAVREEDRERLFLAFRAISSPTGRRIGGLGLSLAFARSLVRAHGGDISYATRGADASLSVTLPLDAD